MKKNTLALAVAALALSSVLAPAQAQSQDGKFLVRFRATQLQMANTSDAIPGLGIAADQISVNDKWIPEVDVSYFFTPNIAAELVLTIPQEQDVSISGTKIGTFKHLPPTLLAQYHFTGLGAFKPYVGAGLNYTRIWGNDMAAAGANITLDKKSIGAALQIGMDYALQGPWSLNVDLKKLYIASDVYANGSKISNVKLDPTVLSIGVGYRF